ncbi:hypothetical protein L861_01350 [Litchfieldella anticariensis FP35 = DSM 16096]|uniref:Type VI secretion system tip protein VgrG n=1 Tax=Litchfieldella anticariensis (strain DSM 16096 / CECT 5854 / CIP 108499 / LMG 22089 / FP35) TaxID=1121939 RepID=S2LH51_LITA3|nr:type VI secretion system tip protein VgrG [Halomonas anticariensis]EPC03976.1 hypothetical protein L861_01350 [Halomonas anticariensis FP35 = DSM 16096]
MANPPGLQFTLSMDGAEEGTDLAVIDFTLDDSLSKPFTLSVNFASHQDDLDPAVFLDREAGLIVWQDGQVRRRVNGVVSEFACGDTDHRRTFYDVVIRPDLWRLGLNRSWRIFQNATLPTIIQQLCEENGLIDVTLGITRELPEREYVVQCCESDLALIERLAAEEGVFYFHQFDDGSHELVFTDALQFLPTLGERAYHSRAGGIPPQRDLCNQVLTTFAEGDLLE